MRKLAMWVCWLYNITFPERILCSVEEKEKEKEKEKKKKKKKSNRDEVVPKTSREWCANKLCINFHSSLLFSSTLLSFIGFSLQQICRI